MPEIIKPIIVRITDPSTMGEARRGAMSIAHTLGFDETSISNVAIVVSEAAKNILQHAKGGEIFIQANKSVLEIITLDKGPGMAELEKYMCDGYSTAGTSGNGLGAIRRLSKEFDIYSLPGKGTALLSRFWQEQNPSDTTQINFGGVCVPKREEQICGDAWHVVQIDDSLKVIVVDGLGHGPLAAEASNLAIDIFRDNSSAELVELMKLLHKQLTRTRGAAVALAEMNLTTRVIQYAGIGNISCFTSHMDTTKTLVSHNGIVGHQMPKVQVFDYSWPENTTTVFYSDGLTSQVKLSQYPGLAMRHPTLIASVLYRDMLRGRDDATVVVVK